MFPNELQARKDIVYYSHKTQAHGFVSATDGNLSIRLDDDHVLITPSSLRKEDMTIDDPIVINMKGELVAGTKKPSTEYKVHLEAYKQRPDVRAVIHAHPPRVIAFSITNTPFNTCILPEVVVNLGNVPIAPYATPSSDELPASMSDLIRESDSVILARHGSVTVGITMDEAFKKLEKLEHNAEILIWAHLLGGPTSFSDNQLADLNNLRSFYGVKSKSLSCSISTPPKASLAKAEPAPPQYQEIQAPTYRSNNDLDALVSEIVARVKKQL